MFLSLNNQIFVKIIHFLKLIPTDKHASREQLECRLICWNQQGRVLYVTSTFTNEQQVA